ncbi:Menaquinone reductase, molybdopterin-binding-like subunit [Desulfovibrionales bacterium]
MDRRDFVKFLVGGATGTFLTPIPWKLTDDLSIWSQNWPWIPKNYKGASEYVPTVSKLCPSSCGMLIRTVAGAPVCAHGNPDNPLSGGKISALAAAEIQLLYSPARLRRPLMRSTDDTYVAVTWDEAMVILKEKLNKAKAKTTVISGDETGTINEIFSAFLTNLGSSNYFLMPGEIQPASKAWNELLSGSGQIGYDLEGANYVLALSADILESWGPAVRNRRAYAASHTHGEEPSAKYVYIGHQKNCTATAADQWVPCHSAMIVALGLANLLIASGKNASFDNFNEFKILSKTVSMEMVQEIAGIAPATLQTLAKDLAEAKKPIIITGSAFGQGASADSIAAGLVLNLLLDRLDLPGGIKGLPEAPIVLKDAIDRTKILAADVFTYLTQIGTGKLAAPSVCITYNANPVYGLPVTDSIAEAYKKIPFKVAFSVFMDETAMASDLILPIPMGLERLDDVYTPYGSGQIFYAICNPVIKPIFDAKPAAEVVLALAKDLGMELGITSFEDALKAKAEALGASFNDLKKGKVIYEAKTKTQGNLALKTDVLVEGLKARIAATQADLPLYLAPIAKLNIGSHSVATPPFNLKTIPDTELSGKDLFVQLNAKTADSLGVKQGDPVKVESNSGAIRAKVNLTETVMDDVVAVSLGFGRTAWDEFTKNKGANASKLLVPRQEPGTGLTVWTSTRVKIAKV